MSAETGPSHATSAVGPLVLSKSRRRARFLSPGRLLLYALVIAGAVVFALPFLWMVSTSIKPENKVFAYPPEWVPTEFTLVGFREPWENLPFLVNTVLITALNLVGYLGSCSLVAFAFARMRFRGRGPLFILVLSTMMLPGQVTLIPLYRLWSELGLVNTIGPLTIPAFFAGEYTGAFTVFLLRQYMMTLPFDLDDAAAIFLFTGKWNEFLQPLIYLQTQDRFTVPLGLAQLNTRFSLQYNQTMAQTLISLVPVLLVFFLVQHRYVQGIVISGVKG